MKTDKEKKPKATDEKLSPENLTMMGNIEKLKMVLFEQAVIKNTDNFWTS